MVSLDELGSALRPDAPRGGGIGDRDEHADTEHTGENSNWELSCATLPGVCDRVSHTSFGERNLTVGHLEQQ